MCGLKPLSCLHCDVTVCLIDVQEYKKTVERKSTGLIAAILRMKYWSHCRLPSVEKSRMSIAKPKGEGWGEGRVVKITLLYVSPAWLHSV